MACTGCGRRLPSTGRVTAAKAKPVDTVLCVVLGFSGPLTGAATGTNYGEVKQGQILRVHLDDMSANRHLVRATQETLKIARAIL
jgi:hypothetical protein